MPAPSGGAEFRAGRKGMARLSADLSNPARTLKRIGALLVAQGQRAFREQRFGSAKWPARYSGISGPYVSVAGVLADVAKGSNPKARRFADRVPALVDTGLLRRSLTSE